MSGVVRDACGRLLPGASLNPGGRPKLKFFRAAYLRLLALKPGELERYEAKDGYERHCLRLMGIVATGAAPDAIAAAREIANRIDGQAKETVEFEAEVPDKERLAAILARIAERREEKEHERDSDDAPESGGIN